MSLKPTLIDIFAKMKAVLWGRGGSGFIYLVNENIKILQKLAVLNPKHVNRNKNEYSRTSLGHCAVRCSLLRHVTSHIDKKQLRTKHVI